LTIYWYCGVMFNSVFGIRNVVLWLNRNESFLLENNIDVHNTIIRINLVYKIKKYIKHLAIITEKNWKWNITTKIQPPNKRKWYIYKKILLKK